MFRAIKLFKGEDDAVIAPVKARCLDYHYERREVYAYTNKTIIRYNYSWTQVEVVLILGPARNFQ